MPAELAELVSIVQQFGLAVDDRYIQAWQGGGLSNAKVWQVQVEKTDGTRQAFSLHARPYTESVGNQERIDRLTWQAATLHNVKSKQGSKSKHSEKLNASKFKDAQSSSAQMNGADAFDFILAPLPTRHGRWWVDANQHCWTIEAWANGQNNFHQHPTQTRLNSVATSLAKLHAHWLEHAPRPDRRAHTDSISQADSIGHTLGHSVGLNQRLQLAQTWHQQSSTLWAKLQSQVSNLPDWSSVVGQLHQQTLLQLPGIIDRLHQFTTIELPLGPILGDPWSDHLFFDERDQLSAIIDYQTMRWDSPVADLSRATCSLIGWSNDANSADWSMDGHSFDLHLLDGKSLAKSEGPSGVWTPNEIPPSPVGRGCQAKKPKSAKESNQAGNQSDAYQLCRLYRETRDLDANELAAFQLYGDSSRVLGTLLWLRWIFLENRFQPSPSLLHRVTRIATGLPF